MVSITATVRRVGAGERQIPSEELVVGDIVTLFVGDIVPADCKLLESRDLRIAHGGRSLAKACPCARMLPLIVTVCLSRGARAMASGKAIVRRLDAIETLGGMDVLCVDKTGTLTSGVIKLDRG